MESVAWFFKYVLLKTLTDGLTENQAYFENIDTYSMFTLTPHTIPKIFGKSFVTPYIRATNLVNRAQTKPRVLNEKDSEGMEFQICFLKQVEWFPMSSNTNFHFVLFTAQSTSIQHKQGSTSLTAQER